MKLIGYKKSDDSEIVIPEKRFLVDGYSFGDRILEGVMFTITFEGNKVAKIEPVPEFNEYLKQLNLPYWIEKAKIYVESMILPNGDEVIIPPDLMDKYDVNEEGGIIE